MGRSCRYENRVARIRQDGAAAKAEPHPTGNHGELLLLDRMGVTGRNVSAGRQKEVEGEQPAAGLRAALANDDPLTAVRIVDHAPGRCGHFCFWLRHQPTPFVMARGVRHMRTRTELKSTTAFSIDMERYLHYGAVRGPAGRVPASCHHSFNICSSLNVLFVKRQLLS